MTVFDIPIEGESVDELIKRVKKTDRPYWIVTANPEILLTCRSDRAYAKTIQQADTCTVDGFGLWAFLRFFGQKTERVTGVDLSERLLQVAQQEKWRVAFLGGEGKETAKQAGVSMQEKYPGLCVATEHGGRIDREGNQDEAGDEACQRLTVFAPHVLFVAFGHPKQEYWILKHLSDFPGVKVVIGVGGTLEYWAGTIARAPRFFQMLGFEWLWRLMQEPKRMSRILRAVFVFPTCFLIDRLC